METIAINTETAELTDEQFFRLCADNKEIRFERDKFKNIIIMAPTGYYTGYYHIEISGELRNWNKKNKAGYCFDSSAGFTLPNGAVRNPDAAWIAKERWEKVPQNDKEQFAHLCPDFIIEVRSKSDSLLQLKTKMNEWIENGCRLAWLVDMENKQTYIYRQNTEVRRQTFTEKLSGEDVLPEFELNLRELFEQ